MKDVMVYRKLGGEDCVPVTGDDRGGDGSRERGVSFRYIDEWWGVLMKIWGDVRGRTAVDVDGRVSAEREFHYHKNVPSISN